VAIEVPQKSFVFLINILFSCLDWATDAAFRLPIFETCLVYSKRACSRGTPLAKKRTIKFQQSTVCLQLPKQVPRVLIAVKLAQPLDDNNRMICSIAVKIYVNRTVTTRGLLILVARVIGRKYTTIL
jgi:hypothetical protein